MNDADSLIRADSAGTPIELKPVPFPDLLAEIRRFYRAVGRRKGVDFAISIDADVPPAMVTDRLRLREMLDGLLAGAFESAGAGGITLRVRRATSGPPEATVIAFDVTDGGPAWAGGTVSVYLPLVMRPR